MTDKIQQVKEILNDAMTVHCKEARDFCDKFKDCQDCALHRIDALYSQTEESYPCIKCGKLRPEIVSRLKNVSNQKFITESQMLEKLNQFDTEEYKEALYYAQLGSATNGKTVIDELVKAIRADERKKYEAKIKELEDGIDALNKDIASLDFNLREQMKSQLADQVTKTRREIGEWLEEQPHEEFKDATETLTYWIPVYEIDIDSLKSGQSPKQEG